MASREALNLVPNALNQESIRRFKRYRQVLIVEGSVTRKQL